MRFSYSMPRVVLLIFGVAYFALWAWNPIQPGESGVFKFLGAATNYLFPALLFWLYAIFYLNGRRARDAGGEARGATRDTIPLFILAAVLYLPLLFIAATDEGLNKRNGFSAFLAACFVVLWLALAYEQSWLSAGGHRDGEARGLEKFWRRVGRWCLRVAGWLHPGVLAGTGAILVLASLFLPIGDAPTGLIFLRGDKSWITSISEVTGNIQPIVATKAFLGRAVYVLALGAAVITIILVLCLKFQPANSRASRLWMGLTGLSCFLAIYSAVDLNFGWLGLWIDDGGLSWASRQVGLWVLFCLWLILWLIPLVLWVRLSLGGSAAGGRPHVSSFSWLILLFLPAVLYDAAMVPLLVGDFLNLTGMASYVAGLQFLCWGFVHSVTVNRQRVSA